jgi:hypothetical protein
MGDEKTENSPERGAGIRTTFDSHGTDVCRASSGDYQCGAGRTEYIIYVNNLYKTKREKGEEIMNYLDKMYLKTKLNLGRFLEEVLTNEDGDTNLISIIIVLGIVLALVVVFRDYIGQILDKIKGNVSSFSNDAF